MQMKTFVGTVAAVAVLAGWAGAAAAANFDLNLTGVVSEGSFSQQTIGATHYDQWVLALSGLDAGNAITVAQGDTITATITLDQPFTVPASQLLTSFSFLLFGSAFPSEDTGVKAIDTHFFLSGNPGPSSSNSSTTTSSQLAAGFIFSPPNNGAFTFDSLTSSFTINDLAQSATLDGSAISYTLFSGSATPEPASWALMLLGFGGLGATLRQRRRAIAA